MNEALARKVRIGYGIFLSVLTVVLAFLFIFGAASIYDFGEGSYSREIVGQRLKPLMIVMAVWILAIIGGYVVSVVLPAVDKKKSAPSPSASIKRLRKRIPQGSGEPFLAEKKRYDQMQLIKLIIWSVCALFALIAAIMTIVYLASGAHFNTNEGQIPINTVIVNMVKAVLPWIGCAFLLFIGATLYEYFTAKRELASMKKLLVLGKGAPVVSESALIAKRDAALAAVGKPQVRMGIRIAVFSIAIVFILVGLFPFNAGKVWFAGFSEVMTKAINICTECIGLG